MENLATTFGQQIKAVTRQPNGIGEKYLQGHD